MKRLLAIFIALLLPALPALAEAAPMGPFDYTDDILEDGTLVYYFQDLALRLPANWAGKVLVLQDGTGAGFYQKASYDLYQAEGVEGGGFLFSLEASVNADFADTLPTFEYLGFSERSAMNYFLATPSDYPAWTEDEAVRAEWDAMYAQVAEFIVPNAQIYE